MTSAPSPQLAADGRLRHLLTLDGLPAATLEGLLAAAEVMRPKAMGGVGLRERLAGRTVCTLFFETSTRTRSSFQLAATRLGADVLNFDVHTSSTRKGESALDTMRTLEAMGVDCFIVRHAHNGMVATLAAGAQRRTAFINAGDGQSAHPTQGLLDMLTLRQRKGSRSPSSATSAIRGWRARTCTRCVRWAPPRYASARRRRCCRGRTCWPAARSSSAWTRRWPAWMR